MKNAKQFAEELSIAYSTGRYERGWMPCIKMLRKRGYNDQQIEAIIRSKWTRWAADASKSRRANSADLERFLEKMKDSEHDQVEALTREHWGKEYKKSDERPSKDPSYKLIFNLPDLSYPLEVYKADGLDIFKVKYGKHVNDKLTVEQAAVEIGSSILHALECEGKMD